MRHLWLPNDKLKIQRPDNPLMLLIRKVQGRKILKWCRLRDSNPRPPHYE